MPKQAIIPRKTVILACVGTTIEWTEFVFYGYMSNIIAKLFFPQQQVQTALLATYGIFAVSYIARPIGSILFGHIGDKWGRKPALTASMIVMGIATTCMGFIPTYTQIGIAAPILLLFLKIIQNMALSGEYHGAAIFLMEKARAEKRLWAGAIISFAAGIGMLLGALTATIVNLPIMPDWAWRIPFVLSGFLCIAVFYWRGSFSETKEFLQVQAKHEVLQLPLLSALRKQAFASVYTLSISAIVGSFFYINNMYYISYLTNTTGLAQHIANSYAMFGQVIASLTLFAVSRLDDNVNFHRIFYLGIGSTILVSPFMFWVAADGKLYEIALAEIVYGISSGLMSGPLMRILLDMFPANTRYSGMSVSWNVGAAIFSGPSMMIALALNQYLQLSYAPGIFIASLATCALMMGYFYNSMTRIK